METGLPQLIKRDAGVEAIDLLMSKENPSENRGFSFVAFYNNEAAAAAKDALTRSDVKCALCCRVASSSAAVYVYVKKLGPLYYL